MIDTTRIAVLLFAANVLAAVGAGAELAANEAAPPSSGPPDPQSIVSGGVTALGGGPVVVHLRDIPTGDPQAAFGFERSHVQGDFLQEGPVPNFVMAPELEDGAVFGQAPAAAFVAPGSESPDAPGDLRRSFDGQTATGWRPPDPVLAVGPKYIVEVPNSGFTIFSKDGGLDRAYTDLETFFQPVLSTMPVPCTFANCFVFDPRVTYSNTHNKFVLFALANDNLNQRSYMIFAVSQSSDPLGGWWQYWTGAGSLTAWTDYSGMSVDPWGVYFTGNEFFWAGGFKGSLILSLRPDVMVGSWNGGWLFTDLTWNQTGNPLAFEIQPAVVPLGTPGDSATFFANTFPSNGNTVSIWQMTGDRGSSPTLVRNNATVQAYADPGLARQPAPGADDIEMFYAGVQNLAYSQRHVYLALNDAGTNSSGFYVSKVNVDTRVEARNQTYYTTDLYYYYPNLVLYGSDTVDPLVAVAMSYSSDTLYPSGALKVYEDFLVDNSGDFWGHAGSANYNSYVDGRNRWGDYMGAARDPLCNTAWSVTQFAPSLNVWRTRIFEVAGDTAPAGICDLIFDDGFERGSTANW